MMLFSEASRKVEASSIWLAGWVAAYWLTTALLEAGNAQAAYLVTTHLSLN